MAKLIGVDSLAFISLDGLYRAVGEPGRNPKAPKFCDACFTGDYPLVLTDLEGDAGMKELATMAHGDD
jgi:amidophosphoribosyltransferase